MAGIISNVDSDVQKLRKLKNEIEEVKKALKGINIKVDIDITKGLEAQLRSLSEQYDTVARKISEAEGKILISTKNINSASSKIIEAQEKLSKGAGSISQPIIQGSSSVSMAEVSNIQTQAKAYDELKEEIETVIGTRSQNIKRMMDETNAIRLINLEIKRITRAQGESSTISAAQQKRLEQLNNSLVTHKAALSEVRQNLNNNVRMDNAAATSMNGLSQSLSRMRVAYRELTEDERKSKFGRELLASINQADLKIKELDATIGNHQRNVGNYGKQWNGLSMSIQQVGRELPSLAYGPKVFFSAISNNLPILADEIKRARTEYDLLKKSGQSATPVWKQIASSLFSWQSALTVGITLLTLYGDKMVNWISGLIKAKNATDKLDETTRRLYISQRDLSSVIASSTEHSAHEITKLNLLYKIATDVTKSTKERNDAVKELKKSYPGHLKNLSDESIKNGEVSSSIKEQTNQIIANAKATAAADRIAQNWYKSFQSGVSKNIAYITKQRLEQDLASKEAMVQQLSLMRARPESYVGLAKDIDVIKKQINEADSEIRKHENLQESYRRSSTSLEKLVTVSSLTKDASKTKRDSDTGKNAEKQAEELRKQTDIYKILLSKQALEQTRAVEDLQNSVVDERIKAMSDGSEKVIAQMEHNYEKEMQAIDRQKEDALRKKIEDARSSFEADPKNKGKSFNASGIALSDEDIQRFNELYKATLDGFIKEQEDFNQKSATSWNEYLKEFGSYLEKRKAIQDLYQDKISKAGTEGEKAILGKQMQNELDTLDDSIRNSATLMGQLFADASKKSVNEIQTIIDKAELLMKYLESARDEQGNANIGGKAVSKDDILNLGISENTLQNIENAPEKLEALRKAITDLKGEVASTSPFKAFAKSVDDAFDFFKKGGKDGAAKGVMALGNAVSQFSPALQQFGMDLGNIVGNDDLGNKIAGIAGAVGGLGQTAAGVGQIMSGDIVGGAMSAVNGISKVVDSLDGLFGADYSHYNKMKAEYDSLIEVWDTLIDRKKKYINIDYGDEARKVGQEAIDLLNKKSQSNVDLGKEWLNSGASAGSHSIGVRQRKGMSSEGWNQLKGWANNNDISNTLFSSIKDGRMTGLFDLTAKQLATLQEQAPTFWAKLNDDVKGYLEGIIKCNDEIEAMRESLKETLSGVSFDSFYDKFVDLLSDMNTSSEDFANNFGDYLKTAILSNIVAEKYRGKIKELYDKWASYSDSDGNGSYDLTAEESQSLKDAQRALSDQMLAERDSLAKAFGWTSSGASQSATSKGFQTMSQDTGTELNGRFTALQIAGEAIRVQSTEQTRLLTSIDGKMSLLDFANRVSQDPKMTLSEYAALSASSSTPLSTSVPDVSAQNKAIINSSYQPQVNINFPTDRLDSLAADLSTLKGTVEEMRDAQVVYYPNMVEKTERVVKNIPVANGKLNDINDNIKKAL